MNPSSIFRRSFLSALLALLLPLALLPGAFAQEKPIATPKTAAKTKADAKAKKAPPADPMDTTNWRQWAPKPAPVYTPEESHGMFKVAPGFRVELVAAAPLIKDPVFAEWDMEGRLWVCEFQSYMLDLKGSRENEHTSRVVVLEDTDGDGRMDKSTPFLENVINPRSLSIVEGGALVALGIGKLIYAEDTDGDLRADTQTNLIDFATAARGNIEHAENGLHFAIDNWMYNSKSKRRLAWQDNTLTVSDTRTRGQWGMSTDAYGRLYYNSNSRWFSTDSDILDGVFGTPGAPHNLIRAIRVNTALNRAYKPGMIQPDGRIKGVTSISGLAVHSHGAFGDDWEGAIFSFSPGCNAIGAFTLKAPLPVAPAYEHRLYPDETWQQREFLASTDERFRPVNGSFGPDGCLTVVDFYRGIIQHKKFLTKYLSRQSSERELDRHLGDGRIWRIVPEKHTPVAKPDSLLAGLSHPRLWWRLASQKRIVQSNKTDLVPALRKLARDGSPTARAHALWTLNGLNQLDDESLHANLTPEFAAEADNWFPALTALRLAGDATANPFVFPTAFTDAAQSVATNTPVNVLAKYANTLATDGYPNRFTAIYRDKMPTHIKKDKTLSKRYLAGQKTYNQFCAACHQPHGKGLKMLAPTLVKSDWVTDTDRLLRVALHGLQGPIHINGKPVKDVPPIMPGHGFLTDQQLADALTYVRNAWGNNADPLTPKDVATARADTAKRFLPWKESEFESQ